VVLEPQEALEAQNICKTYSSKSSLQRFPGKKESGMRNNHQKSYYRRIIFTPAMSPSSAFGGATETKRCFFDLILQREHQVNKCKGNNPPPKEVTSIYRKYSEHTDCHWPSLPKTCCFLVVNLLIKKKAFN
jgi:hypothetical protein